MANKNNPYQKFPKKQLILRDRLAIDRTILANDRTFLSYVRTSLALIAAGAAVFHFYEGWIRLGSIFFTTIGIILFILGYIKYKNMNESIKKSV